MKRFPDYLRPLEHEIAGNPVDVAIVIRDSNGRDPNRVETEMREKIQGHPYSFCSPVRFHAVRHAMDAWLLADAHAIDTVSRRLSGKTVTRSYDAPEDLLDPKSWLRKLLSDHNVSYTAEVCREIAQATDLQILEQRCPRFRLFAEMIDC